MNLYTIVSQGKISQFVQNTTPGVLELRYMHMYIGRSIFLENVIFNEYQKIIQFLIKIGDIGSKGMCSMIDISWSIFPDQYLRCSRGWNQKSHNGSTKNKTLWNQLSYLNETWRRRFLGSVVPTEFSRTIYVIIPPWYALMIDYK